MKSQIYAKRCSAQRALNFIWVLLTILLLTAAIYHQWHRYGMQKQQQLELIANQAAVKLDNLIESLLHTAYSLPLYGHEFKNCQQDLLPLLKSIAFNNPPISGAVISDENNQIICSTLDAKYSLPAPSSQNPSLFGPMPLGNENKCAFLLQQRLGQYHIGIYVITSVIGNLLKSASPELTFAALYNEVTQKIVLKVGKTDASQEELNAKGSIKQQTVSLAKAKLHTLENITILIEAKPRNFNREYFYNELLLFLTILLSLLLLYFALRNLLNKHYSFQYALSNALKQNHFHPVYQPIMDSRRNTYCGAEVLLRWQTDLNEIIMPDSFIEEAEQSGLIVPIMLQLVERAFQQCDHFLKSHPDFYLSFNLSDIISIYY